MTIDLVARHESAHVAAGALCGFRITDLNVGLAGGTVSGARPSESRDDLCKELVMTLAPAVELGIVPTWPPNPYASADERDAFVLAAALGLDEQGYKQVVVETRRLTNLPRYKRLRSMIERAALEHGSLDQAAIARIVAASAAKTRPERKALSTRARLDDLERQIRAIELAWAATEQSADLDDLERELRHQDQDRKARAIALEFKGL